MFEILNNVNGKTNEIRPRPGGGNVRHQIIQSVLDFIRIGIENVNPMDFGVEKPVEQEVALHRRVGIAPQQQNAPPSQARSIASLLQQPLTFLSP